MPIRILMLGVALLSSAPLLGLIAFNIHANSANALASAQIQTGFVARSLARSVGETIDAVERQMVELAELDRNVPFKANQCAKLLDQPRSLLLGSSAMDLYDASGTAVCLHGQGSGSTSVTNEPWYQEARRHTGFWTSGLTLVAPDTWGVIATVPFGRSDAPSALLAARISLSQLAGWAIRSTPKVTEISVFDQSGAYLFPATHVPNVAIDVIRAAQRGDRSGATDLQTGSDGVMRVSNFQLAGPMHWLVVASIPEEEIFAGNRALLRRDALFAVCAFFLAFLFWIMSSRAILRPILLLHGAIVRASAGDRGVRASETGPLEINRTSTALNFLLESRNVTEEREKRQLNFYAALSQTNQAIVRITDLTRLYEEIPRICVNYGHATMAFVALEQNGALVPVAHSGPAEGFIDGIQLPLQSKGSEMHGPMASAFLSEGPYICNDFLNDPITVPWRDKAAAIGTRSIAAFPFRRKGQVVGVLSIHVNELDFFNDQLIALLEEMMIDLSFAIDNFEKAADKARIETESRAASERFQKIVFGAPMAIAVNKRADGRFVLVNDAFCQLCGHSQIDVLGKTCDELNLWVDDATKNRIRATFRSGVAVRDGEARMRAGTDAIKTVVYSTETIEIDATPHSLIMFSDVTERKESEERIEYLATHDGLTGLPNRRLIRDRIEQSIIRGRREASQLCIMYLDLDRFKVLNDSFGHAFGDEVLRAVADRLLKLVRETDTVARQAGDEFLILLETASENDSRQIASGILAGFEKPFQLRDREIFVDLSIGVSVYPEHGLTAEMLIDNADAAMYRAKESGRKRSLTFSAQFTEGVRRQGDLETQLRNAIALEQMSLVFQPKVDLKTGALCGYETLLRWHHPTMGSISPGAFIPIAEDSGLIEPIGKWVLQHACLQAVAWRDAGLRVVPVSVNVSARQFLQADIVGTVLQTLSETGLRPEFLELELTESLIAQDADSVLSSMQRLKDAGVKLSIDDFGTGYSSLSYLSRFAVDTLKIDQSFIRNMLTSANDTAIVLAIISLARNLRLTVIAEGVETEEQCDFLRANQCDQMQGYHVSRPLASTAFEELLRRGGCSV